MQDKHLHTVFIAHSHKDYVLGLTIELPKKGCLIKGFTVSGIEALEYILEYQPKVAIIEAELPLLSAYDIINTVSRKEVKTQFIVVLKVRGLPILSPLQYIKINDIYYCGMHVKTLLKIFGFINTPKNNFWYLLIQNLKKFILKFS